MAESGVKEAKAEEPDEQRPLTPCSARLCETPRTRGFAIPSLHCFVFRDIALPIARLHHDAPLNKTRKTWDSCLLALQLATLATVRIYHTTAFFRRKYSRRPALAKQTKQVQVESVIFTP